ncbi:MAG: hypothetical protein MR210_07405 [Erysipelotrichaceae bacterium]|nr:hypothetical protein [Erysipelotrichaceae bacterium]MDY5251115.1 hypothetical protein [Erysipelotrichaceae bacterium]
MMIKYFIKNSWFYLVVKLLVVLLLMLLIYLQNFHVFYKIDQVGIFNSFFKENTFYYSLVPVLDEEITIDHYEDVNNIYHKMKNYDGVNMDYHYFQPAAGAWETTYVLMDKDYYIREFDKDFKSDVYPCVLKPSTWKNFNAYLGAPVVGTNEKFTGTFFAKEYDKSTDIIILQDDIFIYGDEDFQYFQALNTYIGGMIDVSIVNDADAENAEILAYQKIEEYKDFITQEFKSVGIDIGFIVQNKSSVVSRADDYIANELRLNMSRNLSFGLLFVAGSVILIKYFIFKNNDFIATSLYLGKSKFHIGLSIFYVNFILDIIDVVCFYYLHNVVYDGYRIENALVICTIILAIAILIDIGTVIFAMMKMNTKKMLLILRRKEAE